jgi:hypothetical protein
VLWGGASWTWGPRVLVNFGPRVDPPLRTASALTQIASILAYVSSRSAAACRLVGLMEHLVLDLGLDPMLQQVVHNYVYVAPRDLNNECLLGRVIKG